ncbi:hypothetical protein K490DRAFT_37554, partial [Saccharata proteae CBS 121410]
ELRLSIYRMALCRPDPILLHLQQLRPAQEGTAAPASFSRSDSSTSSDSDGRPLPLGPLVPAFLRVSQQIYREARPVLYSDNEFILRLDSALATLSTLHQRSRSLIKHVRLDIPTHHDILEGFADLVRLGLRYCWGLKTFTISLPAMFLGENGGVGMNSTTNVYANAFHILRWLPKGCRVVLQGPVCEEIRRVVEENGRLAVLLDEVGNSTFVLAELLCEIIANGPASFDEQKDYQRRQHAMQERNQSPMSKVGPATRSYR